MLQMKVKVALHRHNLQDSNRWTLLATREVGLWIMMHWHVPVLLATDTGA